MKPTMKAAVYTQYGPPGVLQIKDLVLPEPKPNEVLIRIKATAVNSGDVRLRKADPFAVRFIFGLIRPRIQVLGAVYSGEVQRVGRDVKLFRAGDEVFGHTNMKFGAYAEYICVSEHSTLARKPANLSHTEAAAVPFGGLTALHFMKRAKIKPNQQVLVVGALGAVGSAAVQLAKAAGATVSGLCSASQMDAVRSIGADRVIDYTTTDVTKSGEVYDVIYDSVNGLRVSDALKLLSPTGTLILNAAGMTEMLQASRAAMTSRRTILKGVIKHDAAALGELKGLLETGKYKPLVDQVYALDQIAEAHARFEKGGRRGAIGIRV